MSNEEQYKLLELVKTLSDDQAKLLLISVLIMKFEGNLNAMELVINHSKEIFGGMSV